MKKQEQERYMGPTNANHRQADQQTTGRNNTCIFFLNCICPRFILSMKAFLQKYAFMLPELPCVMSSYKEENCFVGTASLGIISTAIIGYNFLCWYRNNMLHLPGARADCSRSQQQFLSSGHLQTSDKTNTFSPSGLSPSFTGVGRISGGFRIQKQLPPCESHSEEGSRTREFGSQEKPPSGSTAGYLEPLELAVTQGPVIHHCSYVCRTGPQRAPEETLSFAQDVRDMMFPGLLLPTQLKY